MPSEAWAVWLCEPQARTRSAWWVNTSPLLVILESNPHPRPVWPPSPAGGELESWCVKTTSTTSARTRKQVLSEHAD